jgi:hypothetical protein
MKESYYIDSGKSFVESEIIERLKQEGIRDSKQLLTKAKFTIKDIEYCIELGKELPITFDD